MPEEQPPITPLHLTQHVVHTVDEWPERTSFMPEWLTYAHVYSATVDGDTVTINAFNGTAEYHLTGETEAGGARVAELVDGAVTDRTVEQD